jgi:hypothetical protein
MGSDDRGITSVTFHGRQITHAAGAAVSSLIRQARGRGHRVRWRDADSRTAKGEGDAIDWLEHPVATYGAVVKAAGRSRPTLQQAINSTPGASWEAPGDPVHYVGFIHPDGSVSPNLHGAGVSHTALMHHAMRRAGIKPPGSLLYDATESETLRKFYETGGVRLSVVADRAAPLTGFTLHGRSVTHAAGSTLNAILRQMAAAGGRVSWTDADRRSEFQGGNMDTWKQHPVSTYGSVQKAAGAGGTLRRPIRAALTRRR